MGAAYPHMVDQMVFEGTTARRTPPPSSAMGIYAPPAAEPPVMLGRSAWAGSQRFGGAVWSGDTSSTFESFNQQFRAGLNIVASRARRYSGQRRG